MILLCYVEVLPLNYLNPFTSSIFQSGDRLFQFPQNITLISSKRLFLKINPRLKMKFSGRYTVHNLVFVCMIFWSIFSNDLFVLCIRTGQALVMTVLLGSKSQWATLMGQYTCIWHVPYRVDYFFRNLSVTSVKFQHS